MKSSYSIAILGGGAAGVFAAIAAGEASPDSQIHVFEKSSTLLGKVLISGGWRCNVTHGCFDPHELVEFYPRGQRELLGPFHKFACGDTMEWFTDRGVDLKIEEDGRVFPVSNQSSTIANCLLEFAERAGVQFHMKSSAKKVEPLEDGGFHVVFDSGETQVFDRVLLATGSSKRMWESVQSMGHHIVPPVASLFTFNIRDPRLKDLAGVSVPLARITLPVGGFETEGPLLITHWGLSGPAVLKLSSFGARWMAQQDYHFHICVDWVPQLPAEDLFDELNSYRKDFDFQRKRVVSNTLYGLPLRLWKALCAHARIPETANWSDLSKPVIRRLAETLSESSFQVVDKSTFKEEFVTAGGIALEEVNFQTFESRLQSGLFFAGEVLDIDALTGGFNFQAAWTGAWLAGHAMVDSPLHSG